VHTHAPPDLGLISSLGHYLTPKKIIKTPNGGLSAGVFMDGWQLYPRGLIRSKEYSIGNPS
jgi:hypothetical protein